MIRKHFRLKRIVLGLAFAVFAVAPAAQAMTAVDGPTPGIQAGYIRQAAALQRIQPSLPPARYLGYHASNPTSTLGVSQRSESGFDWSDAGIGASVTFGGVLILLTAVGFGRRYRSRLDGTGLASA